jgi:hypothetical protein
VAYCKELLSDFSLKLSGGLGTGKSGPLGTGRMADKILGYLIPFLFFLLQPVTLSIQK